MYKDCKDNPADQAECVASLIGYCERLRTELGYSRPDARSVALNAIIQIASSTEMVLNLLGNWLAGNPQATRQEISRLLGLGEFAEPSVKKYGNRLHKTSKLSLALLAQFQIENCLRNLAREVHLAEADKGFYLLARALLSRLMLPSDLIDTLYTPALIRNSLHRNGNHDSQGRSDSILMINGVKYEFRDGETVHCAYLEHIAHALEASVEVLGRIFQTPEILALPHPIMDPYAWEIETAPGAPQGE